MTTPSVRYCHGGEGHYCHPPKECCKQGCCYPPETTVYRTGAIPPANMFAPVFVGHWYFWAAITATLAGILCACSLWRRHNNSWGGSSLFFCCGGNDGNGGGGGCRDDHCTSEPDSNGSCYAPPQYRSCSSFLQAPPPYSEVASKPELYPLVISYNGDPGVKTMVQYFRNFIVRPVGTLSATSTIDSLSSSFICNAANEANNIIPPPYSCMGSLEEVSTQNPPCPPLVETNAAPSQPSPSPPTSTNTDDDTLTLTLAVKHQLPSSPPPLCDTSIQLTAANSRACLPALPSLPEPTTTTITNNSKTIVKNFRLQTPKNVSLESESDNDNQHNFSDLLNLSVCAPGALASTETRSNPQVDMIHHQSGYNSVADSMTSSDISSLANLGTPDSPPRATSPTLEMRELLDKIQQLPQQHKSPVAESAALSSSVATCGAQVVPRTIKHYFTNRSKAKTLYMPLNGDVQKTTKTKGWLSRSAPSTPSSASFLPNFPTAHHFSATNKSSSGGRSSKSRIFDGKPLLQEEPWDSNQRQMNVPRDECL